LSVCSACLSVMCIELSDAHCFNSRRCYHCSQSELLCFVDCMRLTKTKFQRPRKTRSVTETPDHSAWPKRRYPASIKSNYAGVCEQDGRIIVLWSRLNSRFPCKTLHNDPFMQATDINRVDNMISYTQVIEGCQSHSKIAVALIYMDHRNCASHLCSLLCIQQGMRPSKGNLNSYHGQWDEGGVEIEGHT
jgi:hypothetical protein